MSVFTKISKYLLLTALLFSVSLSGCGGGDGDGAAAPTLSTQLLPGASIVHDKTSWELKINSNSDWEITLAYPEGQAEWLTLTRRTGRGNSNVLISTTRNTSTLDRTAELRVVAGTLTQPFTLTQQGDPDGTASEHELGLACDRTDISADAVQWTVEVTSNVSWHPSLEYPDGVEEWASLEAGDAAQDRTLTVTAAANDTQDDRTVKLVVSTGEVQRSISLTQYGDPNAGEAGDHELTIRVSPSQAIAYDATRWTVDVASNTDWGVTLNYLQGDGWAVPDRTEGSGDRTVTITTGVNAENYNRSARLTVSTGEVKRNVTLIQYADPSLGVVHDLSINVAKPRIEYYETSWTLNIASNVEWEITTQYLQGTDWATIDRTSGTGNDAVEITALPNAAASERSLKLIVSTGDVERNTTITQKGYSGTEVDYSQRYELPRIRQQAYFFEYPTGDFALEYDFNRLHPKWVAWPMDKTLHDGDAGRTDNFRQDPRIPPQYQARHSDFQEFSLSRGHLCPSNDRQKSAAQNDDTFYYTNMTPQVQNGFNGGIWLTLENLERTWGFYTSTVKMLWICAGGALWNSDCSFATEAEMIKDRMVTPRGMPVPKYNFKVILRENTDGTFNAIGFWFENRSYSGGFAKNMGVIRTVDEIEELTGLDFFHGLPQNIQDAAEAEYRPSIWGF